MTIDDIAPIHDIMRIQKVVILIPIMNAFHLIEQINYHRERMKSEGKFYISFCEDQNNDCQVEARQLIQDIAYKSEINRPDLWRTVRHTLTVFKNAVDGHREEIGTIVFYTDQ